MERFSSVQYIKEELILEEDDQVPVSLWMDFKEYLPGLSNWPSIKAEEVNSDELQSTDTVFLDLDKSVGDLGVKKGNINENSSESLFHLIPICKEEIVHEDILEIEENNEKNLHVLEAAIEDASDQNLLTGICESRYVWPVAENGDEIALPMQSSDLYFCNNCFYSSSSKNCLQEHTLHCNAEKIISIKTELNTLDAVYSCSFCSFETCNLEKLNEHKEAHISIPCNICEFRTSSWNILEHHMTEEHKCKHFNCDSCTFSTLIFKQFKDHLQTHADKRVLYNCNECNFQSYYPGNIKQHVLYKHSSKPLYCDICENSCYANPSTLSRHMRRIHGVPQKQVRKHKINQDSELNTIQNCKHCEYSTMISFDMELHIKTNHLEKPVFQCKFCEKKFRSPSGRKDHEISVHSLKKQLQCKYCGFKTTLPAYLKKHIKIRHTHKHLKPHHCNVCDYKCHRKCDLEVHMASHTKEKPVFCKLCNHATKNLKYLRNHMYIKHGGAKKDK